MPELDIYMQAEKLEGSVLPLLFRNFGFQKSRYSNELKKAVPQTGWISSISDFASANLLQSWQDDLQTSFRVGDQQGIMQACIKGEEDVLINYRVTIEQVSNDDELKLILLQQVNGIKTVLNTIKNLHGL